MFQHALRALRETRIAAIHWAVVYSNLVIGGVKTLFSVRNPYYNLECGLAALLSYNSAVVYNS